MAKVFKPIGYHLVVKPEAVEEKTKSGIFVPETVRETQQKAAVIGEVVAVGEYCFDCQKVGKSPIKIGDNVVFAKYGGMELPDINEDGEKLRALNDEDVIAVIE